MIYLLKLFSKTNYFLLIILAKKPKRGFSHRHNFDEFCQIAKAFRVTEGRRVDWEAIYREVAPFTFRNARQIKNFFYNMRKKNKKGWREFLNACLDRF